MRDISGGDLCYYLRHIKSKAWRRRRTRFRWRLAQLDVAQHDSQQRAPFWLGRLRRFRMERRRVWRVERWLRRLRRWRRFWRRRRRWKLVIQSLFEDEMSKAIISDAVNHLVDDLKSTHGDNLSSVVLYGSAAAGDHVE